MYGTPAEYTIVFGTNLTINPAASVALTIETATESIGLTIPDDSIVSCSDLIAGWIEVGMFYPRLILFCSSILLSLGLSFNMSRNCPEVTLFLLGLTCV
jgi:hypothetical protein